MSAYAVPCAVACSAATVAVALAATIVAVALPPASVTVVDVDVVVGGLRVSVLFAMGSQCLVRGGRGSGARTCHVGVFACNDLVGG